jgi:methylmalonyl-CoA/ethylmalonyl-CoA epimerase
MLKRIDHIGVVVEDLASSRQFLESLGLELELAEDRPARNVKVAFYRCGDGVIELIEPTSDELRRRRLGEGARARIEHIAFEVDDITTAMRTLRGLGVQLTSALPVPIGKHLNAFTEAGTSAGVQYQLVEKGTE